VIGEDVSLVNKGRFFLEDEINFEDFEEENMRAFLNAIFEENAEKG